MNGPCQQIAAGIGWAISKISKKPSVKPGHFVGDLDLRDLGDGEHFKLLKDFSYSSEPTGIAGGAFITAPDGFVTDLATTDVVRWMLPKSGPYNRAAVVHDWLCLDFTLPCGKRITWHEAALIFYEALLACPQVSGNLAFCMYWFVDNFGRIHEPNEAKAKQWKMRTNRYQLAKYCAILQDMNRSDNVFQAGKTTSGGNIPDHRYPA